MAAEKSSSSDSSDKALLVELLQGRDVACPVCRYNLRNLQQNHCPECGKLIELWVRTPETIYAEWITAVIASSLSAPIGFIFVISYLAGNMLVWYWIGWIFGFTSLSMLVATIVLILMRRRFIQAEQRVRKVIAISCMACSIIVWVLALMSVYEVL